MHCNSSCSEGVNVVRVQQVDGLSSMRQVLSRVRLLFCLLLLILPGAGAVAEEPQAKTDVAVEGEDWPRWRGRRGDGSWRGPALATSWPKDGLNRVWEQSVGGGYAGVTATGGRVLVADRVTEPHEQERLLCFDATTGELQWSTTDPVEYGKLDYGNGPRAAPTVAGGSVYHLGATGRLHCVRLEDGAVVWSKDLVQDMGGRMPTWGYAASPFVHEELVIVQPGAGEGRSIVALHRDTGKTAWETGDDEAGYATPILATIEGTRQLICWTPAFVRSLNPSTGQEHWKVPGEVTMGVSIATPVTHGRLVFVSGYWEGAVAIRPEGAGGQARIVWEDNRWLRGLMSQPLVRDGHGYLLDKRHGLTCFELKTGRKLWDDGNRLTPRARDPHATLISLAGTDRALSLNSDGDLVLARLTPEGYEELARSSIIGETWAHPALMGRFLYARSDSRLVCVELPLAR